MKSTDRIIKDIRYYEIKPKDFTGDFNGIIGNVYQITDDTNSIGQRIARKLNEFEFISGEFDHIYINFTENLKLGNLVESEKILDKRIKYVDYGIEPKTFNSLTEFEKNQLVKDVTFKSLTLLFEKDNEKIIFSHKKTNLGEIATAKYERPIEIEITKMERNNIH